MWCWCQTSQAAVRGISVTGIHKYTLYFSLLSKISLFSCSTCWFLLFFVLDQSESQTKYCFVSFAYIWFYRGTKYPSSMHLNACQKALEAALLMLEVMGHLCRLHMQAHTWSYMHSLAVSEMQTHTLYSPRPLSQAGPSEGLRVIGMSFQCFWRGIRFPIPPDLAPFYLPLGSTANEQGRHGKADPAKWLICRRQPSGRVDPIYAEPKMQ